MFKNLQIYRLAEQFKAEAGTIREALAKVVFVAPGPTQPQSAGFVPPRGHEHGDLVEVIDGHLHMKLQIESRMLPAAVVKDHVDFMAEKIEEQTGRKPGKKALRELKEQAVHELLPLCFTKRSTVRIWIATEQRLLMIDTSSASRAEEVVSSMVKHIDGLALHLVQSAESPAECMTAWLMDGEPPADFTVDRETELKSEDEMKSAVRYARHAFDIEEVRAHLLAGKRPTKLAMTYRDRVSFVLTDTLQLRAINFLDLVFEGRDKPGKDEAFDADAVLATGELIQLIPALIEALGGEYVSPIEAAAAGEAPAYPPPHMPSDGPDPLYDKAVAIVVEHKKASISLVQRHLQIGYNRAARLLETMETTGLVTRMDVRGNRALQAF